MLAQFAVASSNMWSTFNWRNWKENVLNIFLHLAVKAVLAWWLYIDVQLEKFKNVVSHKQLLWTAENLKFNMNILYRKTKYTGNALT
jgi:capsule polysaccharide modification protein KpsS